MAEFKQGVLTKKGTELLAKVQAGTAKITFTKFQIGSGEWATSTTAAALMQATALKNKKGEFDVTKAEYVNDATTNLTLVASNKDNTAGGFYITEVGVFATDGKNEVLYAIYITEQEKADWFPAYNSITPSSITYSCPISVANASSVTVKANSGGIATQEELENVRAELSDVRGYIGYTDNDIYGVEVDFANKKFNRLAGAVNRTAGAGFDDIDCFGGRKRVNLTDDGIELSAYGEVGYTETGKLSEAVTKDGVTYPVGTAVQVMVRQPKFYYKVVPLVTEPIQYPQMEEVVITGTATESGTITVTIGTESKTVDITNQPDLTVSAIAAAIARLSFTNFQTRNSGATVRFVSRIPGQRDKMTVDFGVTGAVGVVRSITETPAGGYHMRKARYYVASKPKLGFKIHPAFVRDGKEKTVIYRAAYESCIYDTSTNTYILTDEQVGDFTATTGDKLSSISGAKPCSGNTQNLMRNNARILAANRGVGWSQSYTVSATATEMLMLIECASFDMQKAIGAGNVNRSWLEDGINWSESTGATAALGNMSGAVTITVPGQTEGGTEQKIVMVTYRGEENPWGNIWKFEDGINVMADWRHDFYIADHDFADSKADGTYTKVGFPMAFTEGYISAFGYDEDFDFLFIASETTGSSSLPVGDYNYSNVAPKDWHIVVLGGGWNHGVGAGVLFRGSGNAAGHRSRAISGGRLVYVPGSEK